MNFVIISCEMHDGPIVAVIVVLRQAAPLAAASLGTCAADAADVRADAVATDDDDDNDDDDDVAPAAAAAVRERTVRSTLPKRMSAVLRDHKPTRS